VEVAKDLARDKDDLAGTTGVVFFSQPGYPESVLDSLKDRALAAIGEATACVAGGTIVRDPDEAERTVRLLKRHRLDALVAVVLSWSEPPNALQVIGAFPGLPVLLWSIQGFTIPGQRISTAGLIGGAALKPVLGDRDPPVPFEWGLPEDERVRTTLERFLKVAHTLARLRRSRLGLVGYASMGSYGGTLDPGLAYRRLGVQVEHIETLSVVDRWRSHRTPCSLPAELPPLALGSGVGDEHLQAIAGFYHALSFVAQQRRCDALTIKCHRELPGEVGMTACAPLSLLAGGLTVSCEGDLPVLLTQLILHYLAGLPVGFVDIYEINEDRAIIGTCGFIPAALAAGDNLELELWGEGYARGVVVSNSFRPGRVTLARLQPTADGDFVLHGTSGTCLGLREKWGELGCPDFPGGEVDLDGSGREFGLGLYGPHYAVAPGDFADELQLAAHLLRFRVDWVHGGTARREVGGTMRAGRR